MSPRYVTPASRTYPRAHILLLPSSLGGVSRARNRGRATQRDVIVALSIMYGGHLSERVGGADNFY